MVILSNSSNNYKDILFIGPPLFRMFK